MILRKYGVAATVVFPLVGRGVMDFVTTPAHAAGDSQISKDEGAFANTTNAFVSEGLGMWSIALSATEMQAARIMVTVIDQTNPKIWEDQAILLETYGNASAQHELDFDSATVTLADDGITAAKIAANAIGSSEIADGAITAAKLAADAITAAKIADGAIDAATFAAGAINAASIATDAITSAKIAADAIGASELAADAVTEIQSGLATSAALATVQADTDDIQTRIPAALVGGRMDSSVGAMAAGVVTAAAIATDAFDADALAADAVTEIQSGLATSAALATVQADTDNLQTRIPAALVGGRMDSDVGAIQANAITAVALAADAGAEIADAVWDEPIAGHLAAGSTGEALSDAGGAGTPPTVGEIVDGVWDELIAGHLAAGSTGEALDDAGAAGTPPTAIEIADAVLTRPLASVEGGSHPFRSLYGAAAKLVNKVSTTTSLLTVTETDDATPIATQALTRDASAEPVIAVDTV